MENLNVTNNTYNVNNITEFCKLPKNTDISVNGYDCKILCDDDTWFGVHCFGKIHSVEDAAYMLNIRRNDVTINTVAELPILDEADPSSSSYEILYQTETCNITFNFYRTFTTISHLNDINIAPLVCELGIHKIVEYDDGEIYTETRDFQFNVYGNQLLPYNHIHFAELDDVDDEFIDNIFQELSNATHRTYTFHDHGRPCKVVEPQN